MKFVSAENTLIDAGNGRFIPVDPENSDYAALIAAGTTVDGYAPRAPSADNVRAEASRRMQALVGARDVEHLAVIIANASREAIRLQNARLAYLSGEPGSQDWTEAETARAAQLAQIDAMLEAIRATSNTLEPNPPLDFADNRHWA